MRYPSLPFFQQAIGQQVAGFQNQLIQVGAMSSRVERVTFSYHEGHPGPASVVVKVIDADWPGDPHGQHRETLFYERILPKLGLPHAQVYHIGRDDEAGSSVLVMEDLTSGYAFPPPTHRWSEDEMRCLLRTYAQLHVRGRDLLPPADRREWLQVPYE